MMRRKISKMRPVIGRAASQTIASIKLRLLASNWTTEKPMNSLRSYLRDYSWILKRIGQWWFSALRTVKSLCDSSSTPSGWMNWSSRCRTFTTKRNLESRSRVWPKSTEFMRPCSMVPCFVFGTIGCVTIGKCTAAISGRRSVRESGQMSNLREIDERLMQLPFQSFGVQLDGLEGKSGGGGSSLFRKYFDDKKMRHGNDALCLIGRPADQLGSDHRTFVRHQRPRGSECERGGGSSGGRPSRSPNLILTSHNYKIDEILYSTSIWWSTTVSSPYFFFV